MESSDSYNTASTPIVVSDRHNLDIPHIHNTPLEPQSSADSDPQPHSVNNDVAMDLDDYEGMPTLQDVSDTDDSSDSDMEAYEVVMEVDDDASLHLIDLEPVASSSATSQSSSFHTTIRTNSNRRARVDDDNDDERDRRHPSQRINSADRDAASASSPPFLPLPRLPQNQPHAPATPTIPNPHAVHATLAGNVDPNIDFFPHLPPPQNNNNGSTNPAVSGNNQAPPPGNHNGRSIFGPLSFSFEIGRGVNIIAVPDQPEQPGVQGPQNVDGQPTPAPNTANPPRNFVTDILGMLSQLGAGLPVGGETIINLGNFGLGAPEKDDPERARKLVDALEEVPVGLVRRLERVGGIGIEAGEEPTNGGDAGCAICWDKLLDADGEGFGKEERAATDEAQPNQSKIVSLPCAHVFHADCLLPWFARPKHTTCPTCRFNIDPEDLTHASMRMRRRERTEGDASQPNEEEPLPPPPMDGNSGDDVLPPPNVAFIPPGDVNDGDRIPPNDALQQIYAEYQRLRNSRTTTTANPTPDGSTSTTNATLDPSNDQPPSVADGDSNTTSDPNPPAAPTPGARLPNFSSTIIQTPLGRMGVIQVPVTFPFPFMPNAGQTPTAAPAPLNVPNDAGLPTGDPPPPNQHSEEIARLLREALRRGAPQTPQPPQAGQTTNANNVGPQLGPQNEIPGTNSNASEVAPTAVTGSENNNANNSRAASDQPLPHPRQAVMEIRVDMVFGQDPFGGLFTGGNGQPGQPPVNVEDPIRQHFANAMNTAREQSRRAANWDPNLREMRRRFEMSAGGAVSPDPPPPQQQPTQTTDQQPQIPHATIPDLGLGTGLHFAGHGIGRSVSEAFAHMLSGLRPPTDQPPASFGTQSQPANEPQPGSTSGNDAAAPPPPPQQQQPQPAPAGNFPPQAGFPNLNDMFGSFMRARQRPRPYKDWTLPPAPGFTLRQRVERREREAGLRCHDVSCGLGPSDEDPFGVEIRQATEDVKQLSIMSKEDHSELCVHRFHGSCLVSAERVALRGAEAVIEDDNVEVSCPVCRGTGCVAKKDWDEGVVSLQ